MQHDLELGVLTLNVLAPMWIEAYPSFYQHCQHLISLEKRLARIVDLVRAYDVVLLQEVEIHAQLEALLAADFVLIHSLHEEHLWAPHSGARHGNTTLIRKTLVDKSAPLTWESIKLSDDGNVALVVRCTLNGVPLCVVNVHLECDEDILCITGSEYALRRHVQSKRLAEHVHAEELVIMAGDFNAPQATPELQHLTADHRLVDTTSSVISRTEYDHNEHVYSDAVDAILVRGPVSGLEVHHFARPPHGSAVEDKIAFVLAHHGSDHVPVGVRVNFDVATGKPNL